MKIYKLRDLTLVMYMSKPIKEIFRTSSFVFMSPSTKGQKVMYQRKYEF